MPSDTKLLEQIEAMQFTIDQLQNTDQLRSALFKLFEADADTSCGFYNDETWTAQYLKLQKMIGCQSLTWAYKRQQEGYTPPEFVLNSPYEFVLPYNNEWTIGYGVIDNGSEWRMRQQHTNREYDIALNFIREINFSKLV